MRCPGLYGKALHITKQCRPRAMIMCSASRSSFGYSQRKQPFVGSDFLIYVIRHGANIWSMSPPRSESIRSDVNDRGRSVSSSAGFEMRSQAHVRCVPLCRWRIEASFEATNVIRRDESMSESLIASNAQNAMQRRAKMSLLKKLHMTARCGVNQECFT